MSKGKNHLFKTYDRQENKTKVTLLLDFKAYKTDNFPEGD